MNASLQQEKTHFIFIPHSERVNTIPGILGQFLVHVVHEAVEKASDQSFLFVAPQPAMKQNFPVFMRSKYMSFFFQIEFR